MRITAEQEERLQSLTCERLSLCVHTDGLFRDFESIKGKSLVRYFKAKSQEEDASGKTAYYVIRDIDDYPMLFFSLKYGSVFVPLQDDADIKQDIKRLLTLYQALQNEKGITNESEEAEDILIKYQINDRLSLSEFNKLILKK